ncbi:MAG: hypothetical protein I8H88_09425 [Burkholderiales bacterium]|nr:hypothetical protein [Burkholderiales bacterium]
MPHLSRRPMPTQRLPMIGRLACGLILGIALAPAQSATLVTPTQDQEVVEVLRERPLDAQERQWRQLRAQARAEPRNLSLALQVASQALSRSRRDGDPRWLGQAEAALAPWWKLPQPPAAVRLLRAVILQTTHRFDAAVQDLQALTSQDPANVQAWLTLAAVRQVTGRYDEAEAACQGLAQAGARWHAQACSADLSSLRGEGARASAELTRLAASAPPGLASWLSLVRAELAERMGQPEQASRLYQQALLQGDDPYTLGAHADFLLDRAQPQEVIQRLKGQERNDALLLRLAEAQAATGDRAATQRSVQTLRARFEAGRERGDRVHLREEARFTLRLLKRPKLALQLAQENWAVQKEPADARIYLEAAKAAGQPDAADPVRRFAREAGWSDARLEGLL